MALITGAKSHWDATQEGILGLEDKKTAQKTWTVQKSWSRYYFSMTECQEVSCGSCVFSWELKIRHLLSSFSGVLLKEVLLLMASQSVPFPWSCAVAWIPRVLSHLLCHCHPEWHCPGCPFLGSLHWHVSDRALYTEQPKMCNSPWLFYLPSILKHRKTCSTPKLLQEIESIQSCQHIHQHYRGISRNSTSKILHLENPRICSVQCAPGLKQPSLWGFFRFCTYGWV